MNERSRDILCLVNDALETLKYDVEYDSVDEGLIFVCGPPRSGTTLATQLLASYTNCGYVNNLMAAFWKAPFFGAYLSKMLIAEVPFTGKSVYGRTNRISEPHEFGLFWRNLLNYSDMNQKLNHRVSLEELERMRRELGTLIPHSFVFKVFQLVWHIEEVRQHCPSSKWLHIERNELDNALSLLKLRQIRQNGSILGWESMLPIEVSDKYSRKSPFEQVVAQIRCINRDIKNGLRCHFENQWVSMSYSELVHNPEGAVDDISKHLGLERINAEFPALEEPLLERYPNEWVYLVQKAIDEVEEFE